MLGGLAFAPLVPLALAAEALRGRGRPPRGGDAPQAQPRGCRRRAGRWRSSCSARRSGRGRGSSWEPPEAWSLRSAWPPSSSFVAGGLRGYLETIAYNVQYANALLCLRQHARPMEEHLRIVVDEFRIAGRWQLPLALLVVGVFAACVGYAWTRRARAAARARDGRGVDARADDPDARADRVLDAPPADARLSRRRLIAVTFVSSPPALGGTRVAAAAAAYASAFALWSALKPRTARGVVAVADDPDQPRADALEKARARFYPPPTRSTYMVFGGNSENGHAAFLEDGFDLRCRWFHLYSVSPTDQFDETLACARRETADARPGHARLLRRRSQERFRTGARSCASARRFSRAGTRRSERSTQAFEAWKLRSA